MAAVIAGSNGNYGGDGIVTLSPVNTERCRVDSSFFYVGTSTTGLTNSGFYFGNNGASNGTLTNSFTITANQAWVLNNRTTGTWYSIDFRTNGTQRGYIYVTDASTAYNTTSDYRLKENVQPMQNALAVVQQLNPVTYTWKINGEEGLGFIAHELQAVVPQAVTGEKDAVDDEGNPKYQGVDTSFLVATLTKAIQELKAEVDELKAKLAA